jgi:hypothetical protein
MRTFSCEERLSSCAKWRRCPLRRRSLHRSCCFSDIKACLVLFAPSYFSSFSYASVCVSFFVFTGSGSRTITLRLQRPHCFIDSYSLSFVCVCVCLFEDSEGNKWRYPGALRCCVVLHCLLLLPLIELHRESTFCCCRSCGSCAFITAISKTAASTV